MAKSSDGTSSRHLYDVAPLRNDGSNFQTWKFRTELILTNRQLWGIVSGSEPKPPTTDADAFTDWEKREREARVQILLTLEDDPLNGVTSTTTSKQAWDSLLERYQGKGAQSIVLQIGALFQAKLSDESALESQLNTMTNHSHVLASLGIKLDDSIIAAAMILALPDSYSTLRSVLISNTDKPTVDAVKNSILAEERSRGTSVPTMVLKAQIKGKPKQGPHAKKEWVKDDRKEKEENKGQEIDQESQVQEGCGLCGLKNHSTEKCRKLQFIKEFISKEIRSSDAKANLTRTRTFHDSDDDEPIRLF